MLYTSRSISAWPSGLTWLLWMLMLVLLGVPAEAPSQTTTSTAIKPGDDLLALYQQLTGKTVLRAMVSCYNSKTIELPSDQKAAAAIIEHELVVKGLAVVQDGPHFVRVYSQMDRAAAALPLRGAELSSPAGEEPAGFINFTQAQANQVGEIYASLAQRKWVRSSAPMMNIVLKTASRLSRREALYAIETALALNGGQIITLDDGSLTLRPKS